MQRWALLLALATFSSCYRGTGQPQSSDQAVIFILADLRGHLAPCGCSERMRGGIARIAAQVASARAEGHEVLVLEGGDSLFDGQPLGPAEAPEAERRAQSLAESFGEMGVAAQALGPRDEAGGEAFLRALRLPNVPRGVFRPLGAGGHRVAVVAGQTAAELREAGVRARGDGAELVIGFLAAPLEQAQATADVLAGGVDLVVATHTPGLLSADENRRVPTPVPLFRLESQGRSLLRLDVHFGAPGTRPVLARTQADQAEDANVLSARLALLGRELDAPGLLPARRALLAQKMDELVARRAGILSSTPGGALPPGTFTSHFVPVESSLPQDPKVKALVDRYDHEVGQLNLAWARAHGQDCPAAAPGEAAYVGNSACVACHAGAEAVWRATKHAHAYATLVEVSKQFHTACVGCHVTGLARPGGVCRIDRVSGRENVGCESCHGPGSLHVGAPSKQNIVTRPKETRCAGCHTSENSPHFDFALYLPRILGPGHGQPVRSPPR
jgi:hypothetical protein